MNAAWMSGCGTERRIQSVHWLDRYRSKADMHGRLRALGYPAVRRASEEKNRRPACQ
jgi:hypothetical protein